MLFTPRQLREVLLRNRVGVSPMCQYSRPGRLRERLALLRQPHPPLLAGHALAAVVDWPKQYECARPRGA